MQMQTDTHEYFFDTMLLGTDTEIDLVDTDATHITHT